MPWPFPSRRFFRHEAWFPAPVSQVEFGTPRWFYEPRGRFNVKLGPRARAAFSSLRPESRPRGFFPPRLILAPTRMTVRLNGIVHPVGIDLVARHDKAAYGAKVKFFDLRRNRILNMPSTPASREILAGEIRNLESFLSRANSILRAPRLLASEEERGVYFEEMLPGLRRPENPFAPSASAMRLSLLKGLAEWHERQGSEAVTAETFFSGTLAVLKEYAAAPRSGLEELLAVYSTLGSRMRSGSLRVCQVHGDLSPDNVGVQSGSGLVHLLDWEFSRRSFHAYDLATFALGCGLRGSELVAALSSLVAEYNRLSTIPIDSAPEDLLLLWSMDRILVQARSRSHSPNETEALIRKHLSILQGIRRS